jgi:peptidyl-prolyl cis-trans isomerase C
MISAPGITVNSVKITPEQINNEVQYHPANTLFDAKYEAMQALVIKELLIQRAVELGLCQTDVSESSDKIDAVFEILFEQEIDVPDADEETCQRFYDNNQDKFFTSPLFEAAHILYLAPKDDEDAVNSALKQTQKSLVRIQKNPNVFEGIAKTESACSSAKMGGRLGQVTKGQTTPVFESTLFNMQEGEISSEPLKSEFGYHIIRVDKRLEGKQLPFDAVYENIANDLRRQSWQRAFSQYIQLLAGEAKISGFQLKQSDTPLVQ